MLQYSSLLHIYIPDSNNRKLPCVKAQSRNIGALQNCSLKDFIWWVRDGRYEVRKEGCPHKYLISIILLLLLLLLYYEEQITSTCIIILCHYVMESRSIFIGPTSCEQIHEEDVSPSTFNIVTNQKASIETIEI